MLNRIIRPLLVAGFLAAMAVTAQAKPLTPAALESWLARYGAAWEARDAKLAGPLFTTDALYQEMPFDAPKKGRTGIEEYWRTVTADQRDVQFESKVVAVNGNTGVAHWSAKFTLKSTGATIELDGVFVLEFDAKGQCTSLREWWHVRTGE
ncbi:MAG TPA: nuclear transport factor 2 family protein [Steroidobacteraceae bacterium]|nr:nuclear transport factor 2 family protein [Steroidobacteraceae bacterium]